MWKRSGSGKPQQSALLAPYKHEVARSSRTPPILRVAL